MKVEKKPEAPQAKKEEPAELTDQNVKQTVANSFASALAIPDDGKAENIPSNSGMKISEGVAAMHHDEE